MNWKEEYGVEAYDHLGLAEWALELKVVEAAIETASYEVVAKVVGEEHEKPSNFPGL